MTKIQGTIGGVAVQTRRQSLTFQYVEDGGVTIERGRESDGTLAQHIGIFVCPEGYAVLPVFGDEDFIGNEFFVPSFRAGQR